MSFPNEITDVSSTCDDPSVAKDDGESSANAGVPVAISKLDGLTSSLNLGSIVNPCDIQEFTSYPVKVRKMVINKLLKDEEVEIICKYFFYKNPLETRNSNALCIEKRFLG